ncbi:MAG: alpha/beta fold hydrolase [Verrucomicrobia bacterium]|nr:alpha/beta fold hydrolase [Verrucomicrobiota bacterium]
MATFEHEGTNIAFDLQGEGVDFVFMHGLGADLRQTLSALSDLRGIRLICLDMPGHGETSARETGDEFPYSFAAFADVALALLDVLSIDSAIFGGISMGAGISLHVALRAPQRVKGLVLVRPAWLSEARPPNLRIIEELGLWIEHEGLASAETKLGQHALYQRELKANPACAASIIGALTRPQALESCKVFSALVQDAPFRNMQDLQSIKQPALVVGNEGDPLHPAVLAQTLAQQLPQARYLHVAPRYLQTEQHHRALNQGVQQFLDNHKLTSILTKAF